MLNRIERFKNKFTIVWMKNNFGIISFSLRVERGSCAVLSRLSIYLSIISIYSSSFYLSITCGAL